MRIASYLPIFPGFYGSLFQCDCEDIALENIEEDTGKRYEYEDIEWDYEEYDKRVAEACVEAIEKELRSEGFDINLIFEKVVSPKYYNFGNDSINVTYQLDQETFESMVQYAKISPENWGKYLEENYRSRDGFISSYSVDKNVWFDKYLKPDSSEVKHAFGALLDFILRDIGYKQHDLFSNVAEETSYIDYEIPGE